MENGLEEFDDIRPYTDEELKTVLKRIISNPWLLSGIRKMRFPYCPPFLRPLFRRLIRFDLWRKLRRISTVDEFQRKVIVNQVINYVLKKTSNGITSSGTEHLKRGGAYLYISTHRDIVLDSALINYVLAYRDLDIAEIAFGDNLLQNEFVSDLIRVNKSFIVYRNLPIREKAEAARHLSRYIRYTIGMGNSVWIAQAEGRAKDGNDTTNPSILKMLYLAERESGVAFPEFTHTYNIVPIAVSYEFDPCDVMKARELYKRRKDGYYSKRSSEDLISMYTGLKGGKGRIHVAFDTPIRESYRNPKELAEAVDRRIYGLYRLWPSNFIAYDTLAGHPVYGDWYSQAEREVFLRRFKNENPQVRELALQTYAGPVKNRVRVEKEQR